MKRIRVTLDVAKVLTAFLSDTAKDWYGYEIMGLTRMSSGTLYPILTRLEKAGWIERLPGVVVEIGRPPRIGYHLPDANVLPVMNEVAAAVKAVQSGKDA